MSEPFQSEVPPLVTVAMPVYNAGKYLRQAVLSIIKQTFTAWELLIIDDGSTDNSLQDIADINDIRIRIYRNGTNKGLAARLNEAIDLARGKYLARMDQDDVSYPQRLARQIEEMHNDPRLDLGVVRAITINEDNQVTGLAPYSISHDRICAHPWKGFYLPHPTWMGKLAWFRKHRYSLSAPYFSEDQELLLRTYRESRFGTIDQVLFAYRIRSKVNWRKLTNTRKTVLRIQLRHFMETDQWHFMLLSILTFVGRVTGDLLNFVRRLFFPKQRNVVASVISSQWLVVLDSLADKPKRPR